MDVSAESGDREICLIKRCGGAPEEARRIYLLQRRDRLADDGRMRCVAATGDPRVAEQWRLGGTEAEPRSWEPVLLCDSLEEALRSAGP